MSEKPDNIEGKFHRAITWLRHVGPATIAFAAVSLAVWEGLENRRHNRLSVTPNVDAARDFDMVEQSFRFGLLSSGLGPAVVKDVRLYVDGKKVHDRSGPDEAAWSQVYPLFRSRNLDVVDDYIGEGQFLVSGERYDLLSASLRDGAQRIKDFREIGDRIDIVVCYCSIYGDQCALEHLGVNVVDEGFCP